MKNYLDGKTQGKPKKDFLTFSWMKPKNRSCTIPINKNVINLMKLSNRLFYELHFTSFPPGLNGGIIETKKLKKKGAG